MVDITDIPDWHVDVFSPVSSAWFGDLKDGVHDGSANDPRVQLISVSLGASDCLASGLTAPT